MKIMNKLVALAVAVSMFASLAITASASFASVTLTPSAKTVEAGATVTLDTTWDTLVGAKGLSIKVFYDNTAFSVDSSNNTDYNFGTTLKKSYLPKYIAPEFVASRHAYLKSEEVDANFNITTMFPGLTPNDAGTYVAYVFADTSGETIIDSEVESFATNSTLGTIFNVKADAVAKDYTFTVEMISSDKDVGDIKKTATCTVTVGGGETKEFDTANTTINSTGAVEGKYNGKILKHIATVLEKTALSKKISITNTTTNETRVSDRTISQTLGGIGVDGATVTGDIAIGVLTDTDAVFTFTLVD